MPTELRVLSDGVTLAGSRWDPPEPATALVLMHPGSGPSDRDNDVFFPPIREHLLNSGFAVASFDKRGVGGSSGSWLEAPIQVQSADVLACASALDELPIVLFGHSQGGWVVLDAAAASGAVIGVITSSGPGVTPAQQELFAARTSMTNAGWDDARVADGSAAYRRVLDQLRHEPFDALKIPDDLREHVFIPDDAAVWDFARRMIDHDPAPALARLTVPVLAVFGAADTSVPVEDSLRAYRQHTPPALLRTAVFPEADHRIQINGTMAPGYLDTMTDFVSGLVRQLG